MFEILHFDTSNSEFHHWLAEHSHNRSFAPGAFQNEIETIETVHTFIYSCREFMAAFLSKYVFIIFLFRISATTTHTHMYRNTRIPISKNITKSRRAFRLLSDGVFSNQNTSISHFNISKPNNILFLLSVIFLFETDFHFANISYR